MSARSQERQARLNQWQARIRECRQSGETIKGWCEREGIAVATYYYWERRCRRGSGGEEGSEGSGQLIRVEAEGLPWGKISEIGSEIRIRHGESMISMPAGSHVKVVAELVKALNGYA